MAWRCRDAEHPPPSTLHLPFLPPAACAVNDIAATAPQVQVNAHLQLCDYFVRPISEGLYHGVPLSPSFHPPVPSEGIFKEKLHAHRLPKFSRCKEVLIMLR